MTQANLKHLIDELGKVKAKIADLAEEEFHLKQQLADKMHELGKTAAEGKSYRCTVSTFNVTTVDYKEVVESLPQTANLKKLCESHTKTAERTTVKIHSRTGEQ